MANNHTNSEQYNDDDFFETLAGNKDNHPIGKVMRETILDEQAALDAIENMPDEPIPAYEQARLDQIKKQLTSEGIFKPSQPQSTTNFLSTIKDFFASFGNMQMVGGFASVACVAFVVALLLKQPEISNPNDPLGIDVMRGAQGLVIETTNPESFIQLLETELQQVNANVTSAQINADEWSLEINASAETDLAVLKSQLDAQGISVEDKPPYTISLKRK